jgi:hypothetical protein
MRSAAAFVFTFCVVRACLAQSQIPSTPAGENVAAMLDALNGGSRASLEEYASKYAPAGSGATQDLDNLARSANQLGQLSVVELIVSDDLEIEFVLQGTAFPLRLIGMLQVESPEVPRTAFSLPWTPVPPGTTVLGFQIDETVRRRVAGGVAERIGRYYVLPDQASQMQMALDESLASGDYVAIDNGWILANRLTEQLRAIYDDRHLLVSFSPIANGPPTPSPYSERQVPPRPCGFGEVEQVEPGVGYVKISSFADPEACRARAELVLRRLSDFPVVIFDITDGLGGNWAMSGLVLGHLLDSSDQLSAMHWREPQRTQYLQAIVPFEGVDLSAAKVYVLTSSRTFSASEGFAYDLQAAGRATVVGEVTRGGAHAQRLERIDDRFAMALPFARAVNPITQTNWEGTGVRPDIAAPEAEALATVVRLTGASDR